MKVPGPLLRVREERLMNQDPLAERRLVGRRQGCQEPMAPPERRVLVDAKLGCRAADGQGLENAVAEARPSVDVLEVSERSAGEVAEGPSAGNAPISLPAAKRAPAMDAGLAAVGTVRAACRVPKTPEALEREGDGVGRCSGRHARRWRAGWGSGMAERDRVGRAWQGTDEVWVGR